MNVVAAMTRQPEGTTVDAQNVRLLDVSEGRARGGSRPGTSKYVSSQINSSNRIQDVNYATLITNATPATGSLGIRVVTPVAVAGGVIKKFTTETVTAATTGGSRSLSSSALIIFSTELFGRLYYTDGISYKIWIGSTNTTSDWTPTAGSLPGTDGTSVPRLIEMWRSRIVLSGLRTDPHNWWMSKVGDPLDWDTAPATPTATQAIEGGVGITGKVPDIINCIIPYSDDVLIFGCDHSIYQLSGDPMGGGAFDLISDTIGTAFGRPYCMDGVGNIYFFSSRGGVYRIPAIEGGPKPVSLEAVGPKLRTVDLNTTSVRMAWDEEAYGFHLFLTPFVTR